MANFSDLGYRQLFDDVWYIDNTGSTMDDARILIGSGDNSDFCLVTAYQSNGVGRGSGRVWDSREGMNLLFTQTISESQLVLSSQLIPLWVAFNLKAVLQNIVRKELYIKWPNDILYENRKISGILCQKYKNRYIIGIGLNVNQTSWPSSLENKSTSLKLIDGLERNTHNILEDYLFYQKDHYDFDIKKFAESLWGLNHQVTFTAGVSTRSTEGIIRGVNPDGGLVLECSGREKVYYSGEISFHR
ncbi:biotin--[acetyl-CoA-carboxylase] ligase [Spirochaeta cellobiosiphila]|uniref:biotin--[acetyl-CoA-carboxylase] ligase n=1 Tax=Spirochaeta cellobiosiphila TaxID=504483 RepID=UPI000423CE57|nr:biotin--[acetyl-CoA-carboxylase] ligase [Spirochaeta cellobiosiphila]